MPGGKFTVLLRPSFSFFSSILISSRGGGNPLFLKFYCLSAILSTLMVFAYLSTNITAFLPFLTFDVFFERGELTLVLTMGTKNDWLMISSFDPEFSDSFVSLK